VQTRKLTSQIALVIGTVALLLAVVGGWLQATVLDADTFAGRATALLDSPATRTQLADGLTDQLLTWGPEELSSYRPVLVVAVEATLGTEAFRTIFREAMRSSHRSVFEADGQRFVLDLADSVRVLRDIVAATSPALAESIPSSPAAFLVDVTDQARALGLWAQAQLVEVTWRAAAVVTVVAYAAAVALAPRRRRAITGIGIGLVAVGGIVAVATAFVPSLVADAITDPLLATATHDLASRFVGDLQAIGYWIVGYGVLVVAVANARQHLSDRSTLRRAVDRARQVATHRPATGWGQGARAAVLVAAGLVLVRWSGQVAVLVVAVAGMVVAYFGLVELVRIFGQGVVPAPDAPDGADAPEPAAASVAPARAGGPSRRFRIALGVVGVLGLALLSGGATLTVVDARARATDELRCNGHQDLCERRVDEVAFAGTHNSMAAVTEPGWLFASHQGGIAAQLEHGIRALLLDTHYGVPSVLPAPGTSRPLILTDRAASRAAGLRPEPEPADDETTPDARARAEDLASAAPRAPGATPGVYLCHNWCELGATELTAALDGVRRFVDANPNEVILLFFEDYVAPTDVQRSFVEAGLADRVWTLAEGEPLPTLQEMIDARRTLLVMAQQAGPPPAWYHHGDDLVEDTPFGFTDVDAFTCEANRGRDGAPLLLANHWLDTGVPTPQNGRRANELEVLRRRVADCEDVRGRPPNVVAVDWYSIGDVLEIVDEVNGTA
jgi:hypothetical protein